jgi:Protein of unknown function (DUF3107)
MGAGTREGWSVDVRIGIIQTAKELDVELDDETSRDKILKEIEEAFGEPEGVLWFTDRRGRRVGVPTSKIAWVEVGGEGEERRVGFGAP